MRARAIALTVGFIAFACGAIAPVHADVNCPVTSPSLRQHPAADTATTVVVGDLNGDGGSDVAIRVTHTPAWCGYGFEPGSIEPPTTRVDLRSGATGAVLWSVAADANAEVHGLNLGGGRNGVLVVDRYVRIFDNTGHQRTRQPSLGDSYHVLVGAPGQPDVIAFARVQPPVGEGLFNVPFIDDLSAKFGVLRTLTRTYDAKMASTFDHIRAISAATGKTVYDRAVPGGASGFTVVADVDGDQRQDLMARYASNDGHEFVMIVRGASGWVWWTRELSSVCGTQPYIPQNGEPPYYTDFGTAAGVVGDMNGDGYHEVAVGGYACPAGLTNAFPKVVAVLDGYNGHERWTKAGEAFPAGDANGDGKPEVFVSAFTTDPDVDASHREIATSLVDAFGTVLATRLDAVDTGGPTGSSYFYSRLDGAGDANGDGAPDLLERLGIHAGTNPDMQHVISGRDLTPIGPDPNPSATQAALLASTDGAGDDTEAFNAVPEHLDVFDAASGTMRWSYDFANTPLAYKWFNSFDVADVNGDGRADIVISEHRETPSYSATAEVTHVIDGATGLRLWNFVAMHTY